MSSNGATLGREETPDLRVHLATHRSPLRLAGKHAGYHAWLYRTSNYFLVPSTAHVGYDVDLARFHSDCTDATEHISTAAERNHVPRRKTKPNILPITQRHRITHSLYRARGDGWKMRGSTACVHDETKREHGRTLKHKSTGRVFIILIYSSRRCLHIWPFPPHSNKNPFNLHLLSSVARLETRDSRLERHVSWAH